MSVSKIGIVNLALQHLGMKSITSLNESNPSANAANAYYDATRDDTFRDYNWPFARVRAALTLVTDEVLGWTYIYLYPPTAAAVWAVFDEATVDDKESQEFEKMYIPATNRNVLCTEKADAYADYTYIVTDTTIYDAKFVLAFSYKLAAAMAHSLTGSADMGLKMQGAYSEAISEAKRIGYAERLKKPTQKSSYQQSRA